MKRIRKNPDFSASKVYIITLVFIVILLSPISTTNLNEIEKDKNSNHLVINEICYSNLDHNAGWIELYNPTSFDINISDWNIWFYYINGPIHPSFLTGGAPVIIPSYGYLLFCGKKDNFTKVWVVPPSVRIIEGVLGPFRDSIRIENENHILVDEVYWDRGDQLPPLLINHSWARYRGAYDIDNFTNDFYDELNPTPGYENHRSKEASNGNLIYWIVGGSAAIIAVSACVYYFRKRR